MHQIRTFTEWGLDQALQLTTRALGLSGEQALLHATQALVHLQYHNAGIRPDEARRQLQDGARNLGRAAELDGNSDALAHLSYICSLADRLGPARTYADQAIASDPFNPWALWARGTCELLCGDLETAIDRFDAGVAAAPADPLLRFFQAIAVANAGQTNDALAMFERFAAEYPNHRSVPRSPSRRPAFPVAHEGGARAGTRLQRLAVARSFR